MRFIDATRYDDELKMPNAALSQKIQSKYRILMDLPVEKRRYAIQEYLDLEEKAQERHEFHDGEILAMSGGTIGHSRIIVRMLRTLGNRLAGNPCEPLEHNDHNSTEES
jgi:Uma2 family endonuclease